MSVVYKLPKGTGTTRLHRYKKATNENEYTTEGNLGGCLNSFADTCS